MTKKYFNISEIEFQPKPIHPLFKDIEGQTRFNLTVIGFAGRDKVSWWFCRCKCGKIVRISGAHISNTKSCGCLKGENHGMRFTPEYGTYTDAKNRCCNPNNSDYSDYGGRGIEFRFNSFSEFFAEIGKKPTLKHSLDRIDTNGHYEKGNIRWSTLVEQARNKRNNRFLTVNGETKTTAEWAEISGIKSGTIRARLASGWCAECAVAFVGYGHCVHKNGGQNERYRN